MAHYVVVTTASWLAPDGTTQPAGTVVNRIIADPGFNPGPGMELVADTGQVMYQPQWPVGTISPTALFIARFSSAEQAAVVGNTATLALWLTLLAYQEIDVSDARVVAGMAALAAAGVVTSARATQILNLGVSSP